MQPQLRDVTHCVRCKTQMSLGFSYIQILSKNRNSSEDTNLKEVKQTCPLREEKNSVPPSNELRQERLQSAHLCRGEQRLLRETQVLQAVEAGADLVQIEVRVARDLLDNLVRSGGKVRNTATLSQTKGWTYHPPYRFHTTFPYR